MLEDYGNVQISVVAPESGAWPPADGEILIERKALSLTHAAIGDDIVVKLPGVAPQTLRLSGTTYDPVQPPAWMEGIVYGYTTRDTLEQLGFSSDPNELKIILKGNITDDTQMRAAVDEFKTWVEQSGRTVSRVDVPLPGRHTHWRQMEALLFQQLRFGLLALLLSGVLAASMIPALLLSAWMGRLYVTFMMDMFNFNVASMSIPPWVWAVQVAMGILTPLVAAAFPIWRGSNITIREALGDYGIGDFKPRRTLPDPKSKIQNLKSKFLDSS